MGTVQDEASGLDFIIIGSGVSGGRIAYDLTRSGAKCLLLEAGREFNAQTFPNNELDYSTQLFWGGGLEISTDGRIGFLRARVLGGTSIVNQALLDRFDTIAWDDWHRVSKVPFFSIEAMAPHYDACEQTISVQSIPVEFYNRNAHIFTKACNMRGIGWKSLKRAQGDCKLDRGSDCIVCLGGCPRDSKQSSLVTTIRAARKQGLQIESEFEVHHVVHEKDRVRVVGRHRGLETEVWANKVVLAAGAFGNSAILLRSGYKERLPALGTGFSCHPQYMTYGIFDTQVNAHKGAFQAVASEDKKLRAKGFKLENVFAPPTGTAMLVPGYGKQHLEIMRQYRYLASMEVAIRDEAAGKVVLSNDDKLRIEKPLTAQDRERIALGLKHVRDLFDAAGARKVVQCKQAFGLHLMGGCALGTDPARSVVSPDFNVHGFDRLFAADSSVFPGAPGINPSFTIMALSNRAAQEMVKR